MAAAEAAIKGAASIALLHLRFVYRPASFDPGRFLNCPIDVAAWCRFEKTMRPGSATTVRLCRTLFPVPCASTNETRSGQGRAVHALPYLRRPRRLALLHHQLKQLREACCQHFAALITKRAYITPSG